MRTFNRNDVLKEIRKRYSEIDPNIVNTTTAVVAYGYRDSNNYEFFTVFTCLSKDLRLIGFAAYFARVNILRFYDHEGGDLGIETGMEYKPIIKGKKREEYKIP